jgi:hypothetical protein
MKARVELEYNPVFVDVAQRIAKGEPPLWLLISLNHFSGSIGTDASGERKHFGNVVGLMNDAASVLMRWLPIYQHAGYGLQCPEDVTVVLDALPRIKRDLDRLNKQGLGRPPNVRREICAAVVLEAWKLLHGKAEPRSGQTEQACKDYWQACDGSEIDDHENDREWNWRRDIKRALTTDHQWIRKILLAVQNST